MNHTIRICILTLVLFLFFGCSSALLDESNGSGTIFGGQGTLAQKTAISSSDYAVALTKAIQFYDANRCGTGVAANNTFSWRGNCHTADPVATGFHDAGDHVKFGLPAAYTFAVLAWSLYEYPNSFSTSDTTKLRNEILKRFSDYFMGAYNKTAKTFIHQIAEANADHSYWGPPENQTGTRTVYANTYSQGYADAGSLAAAGLAMMSILYQNIDSTYAGQCLDYATNLYFDVKGNQKYYLPQDNFYGYNTTTAPSIYDTIEIPDKLALAADFMYLADPSKRSTYYADMNTFLLTGNNRGGGSKTLIGASLNWNNLYPAAFQTAYEIAKLENDTAKQTSYFYAVQTNNLYMKNTQPYTTDSSGNHMVYLNSWGSCKLAAGLAMTVLLQVGVQPDTTLQSWAKNQVDYILGNNANNYSYMIGFGANYPRQPHHRGANPSKGAATYTLTGGLVSGPNSSGQFTDDVNQYQFTEVALDYNATMIGALAAVIKYYGGTPSSSSANSAAVSSTATSAPVSSVASSTTTSVPVSSAASSVGSVAPGIIKAQTYLSGTAIQNQVYERIKLVNTGTSAITLSTVKVRYYIKNQGVTTYGWSCDYTTLPTGTVNNTFVTMNPVQTGADQYSEIGFTSSAGSLAAGASAEIQARFWKTDWSNMDNSLNYSYNPSTSYIDWNKVTVYVNGALAWGVVPGGTASSAVSSTATSAPVSSSSRSSAVSSTPVSSTPISSSRSSVISSASSSSSAVSSTPVSSAAASSASSASSSGVTYTEVTAPFTFEGSGTHYWKIASIPSNLNNWNNTVLTINGVSFLNVWVGSSSLPAKQGGYYYIIHTGSFSYSHVEIR